MTTPRFLPHENDRQWFPAALTIGFAASSAMWTAGYFLRLPGEAVPPPAIALTLAAIAAMVLAATGASAPKRAIRAGAVAGLVMGAINLLVLGAFLTEGDDPNNLRPDAAIIVAGWLAACALLSAAASWFGARALELPLRQWITRTWRAAFAWITALTMLPLMAIGGAVTSADAGMAVPDWPNTFSSNMFLFPLSRMTGGVYLEHAHRLFGALVGLASLTLAAFALTTGARKREKTLAVVLLVVVIIQGLLGGVRVTEASPVLALLHGLSGKSVFAFAVAVAVIFTPAWAAPSPGRHTKSAGLATWALALILIQIALGGAIRHFNTDALPVHAVLAHAGFSVVPFCVAIAAAFSAAGSSADAFARRLGKALVVVLTLQMALGVLALVFAMLHPVRAEAGVERLFTATIHQSTGAAILAATAALVTWTRRPAHAEAPDAQASATPSPA